MTLEQLAKENEELRARVAQLERELFIARTSFEDTLSELHSLKREHAQNPNRI